MRVLYQYGESVLLRTGLPLKSVNWQGFRLGVTGGVGAGKSLVSKYLSALGAEIIDADQVARSLTVPGSPALLEVVEAFPGVSLVDKAGNLRRQVLADLVFSESQNKQILDQIMLPKIINVITKKLNQSSSKMTVLDAPLLIETDLDSLVNEVCVVSTDKRLRITRLVSRGLSERDAVARINTQITDDERLLRAHWQLINNGKAVDTVSCVEELYRQLSDSNPKN